MAQGPWSVVFSADAPWLASTVQRPAPEMASYSIDLFKALALTVSGLTTAGGLSFRITLGYRTGG